MSTTRRSLSSVSVLRARLEDRRAELERTVMQRIAEIDDPHTAADPFYFKRLREAVSAAIDFALSVIDAQITHEPPIPVELLAQARIAARNEIGLDTVLRRYVAGYTSLGTLIEDAGRDESMTADERRQLTATQSKQLERVLAAVGEEYAREADARSPTTGRRQAALIRGLLAGEPVDVARLSYAFDLWHIGVIADVSAAAPLREFATSQDQRLLMAADPEGTVWAWLGSRRRHEVDDVVEAMVSSGLDRFTVAIGHTARGLQGWRLTYRQAAAVFPIALRLGRSLVRYSDYGPVASVLRDETLSVSLRAMYLEPWMGERDAELLRETLRAYFEAEQNTSSAAAALGIKRHTVRNRLRRVEEKLGRPLGECAIDLASALRLEDVADLADFDCSPSTLA